MPPEDAESVGAPAAEPLTSDQLADLASPPGVEARGRQTPLDLRAEARYYKNRAERLREGGSPGVTATLSPLERLDQADKDEAGGGTSQRKQID